MKFYLEKRGQSLFKNSKLLLSLDNDFREIYDIGSKALKDEINKYEANFCTDKLIRFLEHLYRYTDLKTLK